MKYKHHWTPSSPMPSVYKHLSESIVPEIQKETGKKILGGDVKIDYNPEKQTPKKELVKQCSRCKYENSSDSKYCNLCGFSIDPNEAKKIAVAREIAESFLNKVTQDPKKLEKLLALISE